MNLVALDNMNRTLGVDPVTGDGMQICGQGLQSVGPLAKWPGTSPRIPWHMSFSGYNGSLTPAQLQDAFTLAWQYWAEVIEIEPVKVDSQTQAFVWGTFKRIDGASNVLAWSMLADNTNRPKEQRYDSGDTWVKINPETPFGGIDLVRVACHEIGHVLGLDHDSGNANALLRPSYSTSIPKPTSRDIQRMIGLGYRARTTPIPPPPVPPVPSDPPPVSGLHLALPGGGHLDVDYPTKTISYPAGWTGRTS